MPRKQKKYHYIYKTTNIITNKYYIGMHSTNDIEDGYIGSGKRLWYSINKYGKENHKIEILEYLNNRGELSNREREIVNEGLLNDKMCMNLVIGGSGGFSVEDAKKGRKRTNEILKEKYGENFQQFINKRYRDSLTDIDKENLSKKIIEGQIKCGFDRNTFGGKTHTDEAKKKMSNSKKGKYKGESNSQHGTCWVYNIKIKENKKINKDEINNWINNGWVKGRKMNF